MIEQNQIKIKVYLDHCLLFLPHKIKNLTEKEDKSLEILFNNSSKFEYYTSKKTEREIKKLEGVGRGYLLFWYEFIQKALEKNIIESMPTTFNSAMFNAIAFNESIVEEEDILFTNLKQIFTEDDAEHIFQAEKNNLDYFLTRDKKTILKPARKNREQLKKINLKIRFVSPGELVQELSLNL